jgi:hypothetical protein
MKRDGRDDAFSGLKDMDQYQPGWRWWLLILLEILLGMGLFIYVAYRCPSRP